MKAADLLASRHRNPRARAAIAIGYCACIILIVAATAAYMHSRRPAGDLLVAGYALNSFHDALKFSDTGDPLMFNESANSALVRVGMFQESDSARRLPKISAEFATGALCLSVASQIDLAASRAETIPLDAVWDFERVQATMPDVAARMRSTEGTPTLGQMRAVTDELMRRLKIATENIDAEVDRRYATLRGTTPQR